MKLSQLRLENLRNIKSLELSLSPGVNLFTGANGAGKTSVLEAVFLLAHARSFRTRKLDSLIQRGADMLSVYACIEQRAGTTQLGLMRNERRWEARINGATPTGLSAVLREISVTCFEPGSHALIAGGSEERRRYLDWGVFHVEPEFLQISRRYARALRQRNALLKSEASDTDLDTWDFELSQIAATLHFSRDRYVKQLQSPLVGALAYLLPELGEPAFRVSAGWDSATLLESTLAVNRERDRARGFTADGPHRADWSLAFTQAPLREHLSRGQEKLCALACMLAQGRLHAKLRGEWPIVCLDDLASELDLQHQRIVAESLLADGAQVLVTGTEIPQIFRELALPIQRFHVEQGHVSILL